MEKKKQRVLFNSKMGPTWASTVGQPGLPLWTEIGLTVGRPGVPLWAYLGFPCGPTWGSTVGRHGLPQ